MKTQQPKTVGNYKSSAKRKVHTNTGIPQETSQTNNLTLQLKQLERTNWRTPELVEGKKS